MYLAKKMIFHPPWTFFLKGEISLPSLATCFGVRSLVFYVARSSNFSRFVGSDAEVGYHVLFSTKRMGSSPSGLAQIA